jgi:ABC-type multidrug transport system fused ATPase/permease subunit
MKHTKSFKSYLILISSFWVHISKKRRGQLMLIVVLMFITSFAELFSLGAVVPFLAVLVSPERLFNREFAKPFINFFNLTSPNELLLPITIIFCITALITSVIRLWLLRIITSLSFNIGSDLSLSIYRRTLYQTYDIHYSRNSSDIIDGISNKTNNIIYNGLIPLLTIISSIFIVVPIVIALIIFEPKIALGTFIGIGMIYTLIINITKKKLLINGKIIAKESINVIKSLQEGLGGIRDVLIYGTQERYCEDYRKSDLSYRQAQGSSFYLSQNPRFIMEGLVMILLAVLAYFLVNQNEGVTKFIPILGVMALGAQRLLPILQQAYAAWAAIRSGEASLHGALELLEQPLPSHATEQSNSQLKFLNSIEIEQLGFRYFQDSPFVLRNINIEITKGSRIGIIGETGSGKSTFLDLIIGLLKPSEGKIKVDGCQITSNNIRAWQSQIAYVSQSIFLTDGTIEQNIAFGVPKENIEHNLVVEAAKKAKISSVIESWPQKYHTIVGERGVRISGGQIQRIGIARALYRKAAILILDEATSALDVSTEQAVMEGIQELSSDLTIFIIAHRLTTLKSCSSIIEIGNASIKNIINQK